MAKCPFCGGDILRIQISSDAGEIAYSACCDVGLDLIDNPDVVMALPEPLRAKALAESRAELVAYNERGRAAAERFAAAKAHWDASYGRALAKEVLSGGD